MSAIHWKSAISGDFNTAVDWNPNAVPGSGDDAIIDAAGTGYTVTSSQTNTVLDIQTNAGASLSISSGTFTATNGTGSGVNAGNITVGNNTYLVLGGTVDNTGSISLQSNGNDTRLRLAASATLSGGGSVSLSDNSNNRIDATGAGVTLTNADNTISGAGDIGFVTRGGSAAMNFVNKAAGVVDATGGNALFVDFGSGTVTNSGLFEATTGTLNIYGTTVDDSSGGVIAANGGTVQLQSATIVGGTLQNSSGSIITADRGSVLDGLKVAGNKNPVLVLGTLTITNNNYLTIEGTINTVQKIGKVTTTGTIALASNGNDTRLVVGAKSAAIAKGGAVTMSDNANNSLVGTLITIGLGSKIRHQVSTLTNFLSISGSGSIGSELKLVNKGTIDATGSNALILQAGDSGVAGSNLVKNQGLIEATNPNGLAGTGGLRIVNTIVNGSASIIEADGAGIHVDLQSATVQGGTLVTANGGVIQATDRGSLLDASTMTVRNQGSVNILNNTSLTIQGAINNSGAINLLSNGNDTQLRIGAGGTTLTGAGTITLSDNTNNRIDASAAGVTLTNTNNTIVGAGNIGFVTQGGSAAMNFVNHGTINASGTNTLVLDFGGSVVTNTGLFEATGTGGLTIYGTTIANSAGVIEANGGNILLQSADIQGGILKTLSGVFSTVDRGSVLDGTASTINNQGTVDITNNEYLTLEGAINNTGTVNLQSNGNDTRLRIGTGGATLTGFGAVSLGDNANNRIDASIAGVTLTNTNNTISGAGNIGLVARGSSAAMTFINDATVNASGTNTLFLDFGSSVVTNSGLFEATGTGGLTIYGTTVANSAGVIEANGGNILLQSADVQGGILKTLSGVFSTVDRGSLLDGTSSTINNQGTVDVTNNEYLTLEGAINNTGSINLQSNGNDTRLRIGTGGVTLNGGGTTTLSDNANNRIDAAVAGVTLTNNNNTISGAGDIGFVTQGSAAAMTLVNKAAGIVNASGANALYLDFGATVVSNAGLLEATGSGGLNIYGTTVSNTATGIIQANGGNVLLQSATIKGGTLKTPSGAFATVDRGSLLDGSGPAVKNQGTVDITNNEYLTIQGTINNSGSINLQSNGNDTRLQIGTAGASLTGSGTVNLSDNTNNRIVGLSAAATLTNTNDTIAGGGQLGFGSLTLVNNGIINANVGTPLEINTGGSTITNNGKLEANGGQLIVDQAVSGTGSALIGNGGRINFLDDFNQNVAFTGTNGELDLAHSLGYSTGAISGIPLNTPGDVIVLEDVAYQSDSSANWNAGILTVTSGATTVQLHVLGQYMANSFVTSNNGGHVAVFDPAPIAADPLAVSHG